MDTRRLVLIVIGALMILVGFTADVIGLGPNPGIGWRQIALIVVGGVVVVAGFLMRDKSSAPPDEGEAGEEAGED